MSWEVIKKFAVIAFIVWALMKGVGACSGPEIARPSAEHLLNRPWIDHIPKTERDLVTHFVLVDQKRVHVGVVGRASRWRTEQDLLRYKLEGTKLELDFPQEQKKADFLVKTWECKDAPTPFDLCLELQHPGKKPVRLYSGKSWHLGGKKDLESLPESLRSYVPAELPPVPESSEPSLSGEPDALRMWLVP